MSVPAVQTGTPRTSSPPTTPAQHGIYQRAVPCRPPARPSISTLDPSFGAGRTSIYNRAICDAIIRSVRGDASAQPN
jgi:hypothetical protein